MTADPSLRPRIEDERLVAFMTARIGEDEEAAHKAASADRRFGGRPHWAAPGRGIVADATDPDWCVVDLGPCIEDGALAEHIVRHDPARVLREVASKRRRLEDYRLAARAARTRPGFPGADRLRDGCYGAVLADAAVYAGHPDYAHRWKLS